MCESTSRNLSERPDSRSHPSMSMIEHRKFVVSRIFMGVNPKRTFVQQFKDKNSWIVRSFSKERYCLLSSNICLEEQRTLDAVIDGTLRMYTPSSAIAIDESMAPYQGRGCPYRMHVPGKPHPDGMEIVDAVDSKGVCVGAWLRDKVKSVFTSKRSQ